ncbi:MAG: hypothetical protein J5689_00840 [Clostridia bacterium]|nr:hypothetical protein [Clostridia bacterium]
MRFEIINKATDSDILEMIELDKCCYVGNDVGDFKKCVAWRNICPEIYTAIKIDGKIVGDINFMPITKTCYNQIRLGKKKDYEIDISDVLNFQKGDNYCLFMSIVISKDFRSTKALGYLLDGLKLKLNNFNKQGIIIKNIVADCITPEGESLAKRFNGNYVCKTKTNSKIYEFLI